MFLRYMENKTEKTTYCGIPKEIEEKVNSKQTVTDCGGIQPVNDITEMNKTVEHFRRECCIRDDWADAIDDDNT